MTNQNENTPTHVEKKLSKKGKKGAFGLTRKEKTATHLLCCG